MPITIASAEISAWNHTAADAGTNGGAPAYQIDSTHNIWYNGSGVWYMGPTVGTTTGSDFYHTGATTTLPLSGWSQASGTASALTITSASSYAPVLTSIVTANDNTASFNAQPPSSYSGAALTLYIFFVGFWTPCTYSGANVTSTGAAVPVSGWNDSPAHPPKTFNGGTVATFNWFPDPTTASAAGGGGQTVYFAPVDSVISGVMKGTVAAGTLTWEKETSPGVWGAGGSATSGTSFTPSGVTTGQRVRFKDTYTDSNGGDGYSVSTGVAYATTGTLPETFKSIYYCGGGGASPVYLGTQKTGVAASTAPTEPPILTSGPTLKMYPAGLNSTDGTWTDSVGGNNGTKSSSATISGGRLNCNGSGDYMNSFASAIAPAGDKTILIRATSTDSSFARRGILGTRAASGGGGFAMGYYNTNSPPDSAGARFQYYTLSGGTFRPNGIPMPAVGTDNVWVVTVSGTTVEIYLNGTLVATGTGITADTTPAYTGVLGDEDGSYSTGWMGSYKAVVIWGGVVLTDTQVSDASAYVATL